MIYRYLDLFYEHFWILAVNLASIFLVAQILATLRSRYKAGLRDLPGPTLAKWSRLWNLQNVWTGDAPSNFRKLHQEYGQIVRVGPNHVAIADPAAISVLYGFQDKFLKPAFYSSFDTPLEGQPMASLFTSRSPMEHKRLKTAVSSKFSLTSLKGMESLVMECTDIFIEAMHDLSSTPVDLGVWLQWYAFDVIGAITFKNRFGFMEKRQDVKDMIAGIERGLRYGSVVGQVPEIHRWTLGSKLMTKILFWYPSLMKTHPVPKIISVVKGAITDYDEEKRTADFRGDFLAMFRKEQEKNGEHMPQRDLMNHLMNNLFAGSDTTAISLRAVVYYVIKTPRVYKKLKTELEEARSRGHITNRVTFEQSLTLPYLQAIIKEAMRMHPGVGFPLERIVPAEGVTLCDKRIPPQTIVGVNAWVVHQNKDIFGEDAEIFRPERWTDSSAEQLKAMNKYFLSFGQGVRSCIGKHISTMEMSIVIPRLFLEFDLEWASKDPEWTVKTYWFAKQSNMWIKFWPDQSSSK